MNSLLAAGGDGSSVFTKSAQVTMGGNDLDAQQAWLGAGAVRQRPVTDRVTNLAR